MVCLRHYVCTVPRSDGVIADGMRMVGRGIPRGSKKQER